MRKHTILKIVGGAVGLVVVLVAIGIAYLAANVDEYKGVVISKVEEATARKLVIGEVSLVPALTPTVALDDVSFANAPWGSEPDMVTAKHAEASVALLPLLSGSVVVENFVLIEPDIFMETDAQGRGNWTLGEAAIEELEQPSDKAADRGVPALGVRRVEIKKARVRYRDGATGATTTLVIDDFSAQADDTHSPLALELAAAYNDTPVNARASLGALQTFLSNESFPLDLTVDAGGAQVTIKGTLERPMDVQGLGLDLAIEVESLDKLSGLAGTELPPLGPLAFTGRLSDNESGYQLGGVEAKVGTSDLSGELAAALAGERPKLTAQLSSTSIDLADLTATTGSASPSSSGKKSARVFPSDPLPFDALRLADVDLSLQAERIVSPQISAQQVNLRLTLDAGRLTLKPAKAQVAGGAVDAEVVVDAASETATLTAAINGSQISLGTLLKEAKGNDIMSGGNTDVSIDLSGQGNSVQALAAGLSGKVLIVAGNGRIQNELLNMAGADVGFQILGKLNPFAEQEKHTTMQCAVLRYDIKDGMAVSDNGIAFETDKMEILGAGTINLKNEALNLLIESKGKEGDVLTAAQTLTGVKGVSIAGLVQVSGTLAAPEIQLNPEGLLKQGASTTAAIATGGLSLLAERLFEQTTTDAAGACLVAQQKAPASKESAGSAQQSAPAAKGKQEAQEEGGVGGIIKGIFGN